MSPEIERLVTAVAAFVAGGAVALVIVGLLRVVKSRRQRSYQDQVSHAQRDATDPKQHKGT